MSEIPRIPISAEAKARALADHAYNLEMLRHPNRRELLQADILAALRGTDTPKEAA